MNAEEIEVATQEVCDSMCSGVCSESTVAQSAIEIRWDLIINVGGAQRQASLWAGDQNYLIRPAALEWQSAIGCQTWYLCMA